MIIRPADPDDADGVNAIYNPFILDSPATFETEPWDGERRRVWLKERSGDARRPVLVASEESGRLCGFASANDFEPRGGYATSVKTSVFLTPDCHGRGLGDALYRQLFEALARAALHRAYALIVTPNPSSIALHKAFGFREVGRLDEAGRKFGRYYSVAIFEKRL